MVTVSPVGFPSSSTISIVTSPFSSAKCSPVSICVSVSSTSILLICSRRSFLTPSNSLSLASPLIVTSFPVSLPFLSTISIVTSPLSATVAAPSFTWVSVSAVVSILLTWSCKCLTSLATLSTLPFIYLSLSTKSSTTLLMSPMVKSVSSTSSPQSAGSSCGPRGCSIFGSFNSVPLILPDW